MKVICVDDERLLLEDTVAMCAELPEIGEAKGFVRADSALRWIDGNRVDLALLDIDMPDMSGIELAARIKRKSPDTAIIFLTGYAQYALDAFSVHAAGYLLKPVSREALAANVAYALSGKRKARKDPVTVKTFGLFDVFVDGQPVKFKMAKCKEILAYLVDRQGGSVTRAQLAAILWEDRLYDRKLQKQLDVYLRSLRDTLSEYGIERIFEMRHATLRIVPEEISGDAYRFFSGDADAVNSFRGEYMEAYPWASFTEGQLYWREKT